MESQSAAVRLGTVVDANRDDIERRCLAGVRHDLSHAPAVELTRLRDGLTDYLSGLVVLLRGSQTLRQQGARDVWLAVARARGVTRARAGFDIEQLVHELVVLGRVIREVATERGVRMDGPEAVLADVLDAAIGAAVRAYVDARDREARRRQERHVSFLTHELRNPLGTAMLTASQLRQELPGAETGVLDRLDRCHVKLSALIDRVLGTQKVHLRDTCAALARAELAIAKRAIWCSTGSSTTSPPSRAVKLDPTTAHLPVLLMSALVDGDVKTKLYGLDGYLRKPFSADTFLGAIDAMLASRGSPSMSSSSS